MGSGNRYDLAADRGDDLTVVLAFIDLAGEPVDMTGRSLVAEVLPTVATPAAPMAAHATAEGIVTLSLAAAATAALPARARWRLRQTLPGRASTLVAGYLQVAG